MDRKVIVDLSALNQLVEYLSHRPYREVVDLISNLTSSIKEIPNETENKTKEEANSNCPPST